MLRAKPIAGAPAGFGKDAYRVSSVNITFGCMEETAGGTSLDDVLPPDEHDELFEQVHTDPARAIPRLRQLIADTPDCPALYNWLQAALQGDEKNIDEIERLSDLLVERFPRYLFGQFAKVSSFIANHDAEGAERFLNGRLTLNDFAPDRTEFHFTEFSTWATMMMQYHLIRGEPDGAKRYLEMMRQILPEDSRQMEAAENVYNRLVLISRLRAGLAKFRRRMKGTPASA